MLDVALLSHSVHGAGSIGVLGDGSDSWNWSSALMWDAAALPGFVPSSSLELRAWRRSPPRLAEFSLQLET